jgi:hypothetical protein
MSGNLFTPRMSVNSNERYKLQISDEDHAKIMRSQNWEAIVTDIETGVQYQARGVECSAGPRCFCDAIAEPVSQEPEVDRYYTSVCVFAALDEENLKDALESQKADIERALVLMSVDGVVLDYVDYDHHDGGSTIITFATEDARLAEQHQFEEVLRGGAEQFEVAPWAVTA